MLYKIEPDSPIIKTIEEKVYHYFKDMKLPDTPTIYDYMILSLRKKDLIATFNWDPFLWQAYERNLKFTKNLPQLAFLHGNVAIGISEETMTSGPNGRINLQTGKPFKPTKLLYPIEDKNYKDNFYIKDQWDILAQYLKNPAIFTIYGYRAPETDIEAIKIMKEAWGNPDRHQFSRIEIINIDDRDILTEAWDNFIFSTHYEIINDFFNSRLYKFPRRTGEVFQANFIDGKFYEEHCPPRFKTLQEMWLWYKPLIEIEKQKE